jgi:phospholipase C
MSQRVRPVLATSIVALTLLAMGPFTGAHAANGEDSDAGELGALAHIEHLVVIYQENRSFDNLYGTFPGANGLKRASKVAKTQVDLAGRPFKCLQQTDPQLTSPPLPADVCSTSKGDPFDSHFANQPFNIDDFVPANQKTRDLVHRFYQEQVQIDGGKMDKFVAVSDAKGLAMGVYKTSNVPVAAEAARYVMADNFFHAAFGGSFLNHAWLVCACTPIFTGAARDGGPNDLHSALGPDGLPQPGKDRPLTVASEGDFAVNTIFSTSPPFPAGIPDARRLPNQTVPTIGDELSGASISWAWYAGGWNDAVAGKPHPLFQFHHQPFNYFGNYAPGQPGRAHLKDESDFIAAAQGGNLPAVSFVKPLGPDNEHPGYADLITGQQHVEDLINAVRNGPNWHNTAIVITYDENGGYWDHVAPPTSPKHADHWGPGARVPAIVVSPLAKRHFVDHTLYDTTSILATIEHRWHLRPLGTRDAHANDLRRAFSVDDDLESEGNDSKQD